MDIKEAESLCMDAARRISGNPSEDDLRNAVDSFRRVSEAGFSQGTFGLAELTLSGRGIARDKDEAERLYRSAAEAGNVPAMYRLAELYSGEGREPEQTFSYLKACCEAGFPPAYSYFGDMHYYGIATDVDPVEASKWYTKAMSVGDAPAMFKLACMYEEGIGIPKDEALSIRMYSQAATAGVAEAQFRMATLAYEGKIEGGKEEAARWYGYCAQALPVAKFNLATMFLEGQGVERNAEKAFSLFHDLAESGDADALYQVGRMLMEGCGTAQDANEGFRYLGKAAAAGNQEALVIVEGLRRRQNTQMIKIDGAIE